MEVSKGEVIVPEELTEVLSSEDEAREFFQSLQVGYK
jgi:hypothetical protein